MYYENISRVRLQLLPKITDLETVVVNSIAEYIE